MLDTIFGLPTHGLVVHAVVVLLPLAALGAVAIALVPALRRRFGVLVALVTIAAVASVPLATQSGQRLYERKSFGFGAEDDQEAGLMERHSQLGEQVLPWALVLLGATLLVVVLPMLTRRRSSPSPNPAPVPALSRSRGPAQSPGLAPEPAASPDSVATAARPAGWTRWVLLVAIAGVLVGAVGSSVTVIRAGHAGSKAVWEGLVTETANMPNR